MTHFTVLVIGDDYEEQLAPYDEELDVDPYRKYADTKDLVRYFKRYAESHPDEPEPDLETLTKYLNARWSDYDERFHYESQGGIYQMSTYNPKSKWDWYSVGGRWAGYFKLKEKVKGEVAIRGEPGLMGARESDDGVDIVRKGDVDVEEMRWERAQHANALWTRAQKLFEGLPEARSWEEIIVSYQDEDGEIEREKVDLAREEYRQQPRVKARDTHNTLCHTQKKEDDVIDNWREITDFQVPLAEFVQEARDSALATFAYVKDGEWYAPGNMGWFASSDETPAGKRRFWREFNVMFDALPDDTLLTLVDCHI